MSGRCRGSPVGASAAVYRGECYEHLYEFSLGQGPGCVADAPRCSATLCRVLRWALREPARRECAREAAAMVLPEYVMMSAGVLAEVALRGVFRGLHRVRG